MGILALMDQLLNPITGKEEPMQALARDPLKRLIVVRPGDYTSTMELSKKGCGQMVDFAELIRPIVCPGTIKIVSSPAKRAVQSAEIVADAFSMEDVWTANALWVDGARTGSVDSAVDALLPYRGSAATLVVVTHPPLMQALPLAFARVALGFQFQDPRMIRPFGKGWLIDTNPLSMRPL